jgi:nucleotide-binding universal stress UspA family protein
LLCRSWSHCVSRILVPVDGSATSDRGLDEAIRLAKLTGARLRLVHVVDGLVLSTGLEFATCDVIGILKEAGAEILSAAKAKVEAGGVAVDAFLSDTFGERVCDVVVTQARQWNADLIVIGTQGRRGARRLIIGSDAEQIVRAAPVPVLLVRPKEETLAAAARVDAAASPQALAA